MPNRCSSDIRCMPLKILVVWARRLQHDQGKSEMDLPMKWALLAGDSWPRPLGCQVTEKVANRLSIEIGFWLTNNPSAKVGTIEILPKTHQDWIRRGTIQIGCHVGWRDIAKRGTSSSRVWPARIRISCIGSVARIAVGLPVNAWGNHVARVELIRTRADKRLIVHDVGWSGVAWHSSVTWTYCW